MFRTFTLLLSLGLCSWAWAQPQWTPEQLQVIEAIEGYRAAWNNFDAAKLASFCDVDCDRIDARGNIYRGREEILRHYSRVFATAPPEGVERKLEFDIISVRIVTPGTAVVDAHYRVQGVGPRPRIPVEGMNTVVLVKQAGQWLRVAHRQRIPVVVMQEEG